MFRFQTDVCFRREMFRVVASARMQLNVKAPLEQSETTFYPLLLLHVPKNISNQRQLYVETCKNLEKLNEQQIATRTNL